MTKDELRTLQAPLKERYQSSPADAAAILRATGIVDFVRIGCRVEIPPNDGKSITAGLHPKAGGDGSLACSGDMLLQALVSCAGTTLAAVATAMDLPIRAATIVADGSMDFRGTLGVDRSVPVGLTSITMRFEIDSSVSSEQLDKLIQLTERYCVVARTLSASVPITSLGSLVR